MLSPSQLTEVQIVPGTKPAKQTLLVASSNIGWEYLIAQLIKIIYDRTRDNILFLAEREPSSLITTYQDFHYAQTYSLKIW